MFSDHKVNDQTRDTGGDTELLINCWFAFAH